MRRSIACRKNRNIGEYNNVSPHRESTWNFFILYFINIMSCYCFKKNLSWHKKYQLFAQHKRSIGDCCLVEHYVRSRSSYCLNRGIPWNVFVLSLFYQYLFFLMFQTKHIRTQDKINCIQST